MKIKELLSDESKWTRKSNARTKEEQECSAADVDATCWCLEGALIKCYGTRSDLYYEVIKKVIKETDVQVVWAWNDSHSFEDVKALVEKLDI